MNLSDSGVGNSDRTGREGLACARGHLEQEAVLAVLNGPLQGVNGLQLIRGRKKRSLLAWM